MGNGQRIGNNCFQEVIRMILENAGYNPVLMYQGSLNFGYNRKELLFGDRICPSRDGKWLDCTLFKSLYDNYGMSLISGEYQDLDAFFYALTNTNGGIILEVDVFNCPWHKLYKRYHSTHYCWVIGYNDNSLKCIIPNSEKLGFYPLKNFSKIKYYRYSFSTVPQEISLFELLQKAFSYCYIGHNGKQDIDQMLDFKNDVKVVGINLQKECAQKEDIFAVKIVRALESIMYSRINFRDLLVYKDDKKEVGNLILLLQEASSNWCGLKNYVIRDIIRGKNSVDYKFADYLGNVIKIEEKILNQMSNYVNKNMTI